jgi:hypothetical protein
MKHDTSAMIICIFFFPTFVFSDQSANPAMNVPDQLAWWSPDGKPTSHAGFDQNGAPLGPVNPGWYFRFTDQLPAMPPPPPWFVGMSGLKQLATSSDFVWSIPFCAVDDTVNPPKLITACQGK